jgi:hypothetical protein
MTLLPIGLGCKLWETKVTGTEKPSWARRMLLDFLDPPWVTAT